MDAQERVRQLERLLKQDAARFFTVSLSIYITSVVGRYTPGRWYRNLQLEHELEHELERYRET
jgi:hypothetical protein